MSVRWENCQEPFDVTHSQQDSLYTQSGQFQTTWQEQAWTNRGALVLFHRPHWGLICFFATKHGLGSVQLEWWLAHQGHGAPLQLCPHVHLRGAHTPRSKVGHSLLPLHFSPRATLAKHDSRYESTATFCQCPANKALPNLVKSSIPKGILPNHGGKAHKGVMLCQICTLQPAAFFAWQSTDIFSSSPSIKDHLIRRPSLVLNKTLCCLLAVSLSHLCSSPLYFIFVLLYWSCFLTHTSRLKNGQWLYLVKKLIY